MLIERLINILLRGTTLFGKFVLVFFLAGYLEPGEIGIYGLLVVTIAYCTYPLGIDFYTYNTREMIISESRRGSLIKNQGALHLVLYIIFLPLFLLLFFFKLLPFYVIFWFYFLLICEHLNQELMRILIAVSRQLSASMTLFLRQGAWCLIVSWLMFLDEGARNLSTVLTAWAIGSASSLILSFFVIANLRLSGWGLNIDWPWIKRGLKISLPLFGASLSISSISTFDKYLFSHMEGVEALGAYVFFMSLSSSLMSFLEAGVFSFIYPVMILAVKNGDSKLYRSCVVKMVSQVFIFATFFSIASHFLIKEILELIGKKFYFDYLSLFYIFLLSTFIQAIGYVPHYALYSKHRDRQIVFCHILSFFFFFFFVYVLSFLNTFYSVPISLCLTYLVILLWKLGVFFKEECVYAVGSDPSKAI